jgi:hypothetical protein
MTPAKSMPPKSISRKFSELKQRGEVAFIPYICAGDPSLEATPRAALALEEVSLSSGAKKGEEKEGFRRFHRIAKQQHHRAEHVLHGLTPPVLSLWQEGCCTARSKLCQCHRYLYA